MLINQRGGLGGVKDGLAVATRSKAEGWPPKGILDAVRATALPVFSRAMLTGALDPGSRALRRAGGGRSRPEALEDPRPAGFRPMAAAAIGA
ncbi:MAG: hypothetical protein DRJ61_07145 [Acidobacteria bacterium]|nr:MAG: hypothetical protein DRJ61_07145 [Acidobacteriota bacterium]